MLRGTSDSSEASANGHEGSFCSRISQAERNAYNPYTDATPFYETANHPFEVAGYSRSRRNSALMPPADSRRAK